MLFVLNQLDQPQELVSQLQEYKDSIGAFMRGLTKAKQKEEDENATDTIPTLAGWMTTLDEDRTMLQMAIDTKDPVLQKILNFRIRLKESY